MPRYKNIDSEYLLNFLPTELLAIIFKKFATIQFEFLLYYFDTKNMANRDDIIPYTGLYYYNVSSYNFTSCMLSLSNGSLENDPVNNSKLQYEKAMRELVSIRTKLIIDNYIPVKWNIVQHFNIKEFNTCNLGPLPTGCICSKIYKDLWYDPTIILILKQVCKSWYNAIENDQVYMQKIFGFTIDHL